MTTDFDQIARSLNTILSSGHVVGVPQRADLREAIRAITGLAKLKKEIILSTGEHAEDDSTMGDASDRVGTAIVNILGFGDDGS